MTTLELLICILLVSISGYMSASEIALFSLSRFQLRTLRERVRVAHRKIKRLLGDPGGLLITILVVTEIVNISLAAIITEAVSRNRATLAPAWLTAPGGLPDWALDSLLGTLITAPLVLFLCEVTPKVVAARANQLIATLTITPLSFVYEAFKPVRRILKMVVGLISRWSGSGVLFQLSGDSGTGGTAFLKESDFLLMVEEGHKEGAIQESELGLIKNVFELDDTQVAEILTPMSQVRTLPANTPLKTALGLTRNARRSRVPIVNERKQVVGILYSKDLLRAKIEPEMLTGPVENLMRRPLFVQPSLKLNSLFRKFKQTRTHLAVVQDTHGATLGIVTMADVLGELFDDIFPDLDHDPDDVAAPPKAGPKAGKV